MIEVRYKFGKEYDIGGSRFAVIEAHDNSEPLYPYYGHIIAPHQVVEGVHWTADGKYTRHAFDLPRNPVTHRHVKRGSFYSVEGTAELQIATEGLVLKEGDKLTVYRGADGKLWARAESEFKDGRFADV